MDNKADARLVAEVSQSIMPMLGGLGPDVQAAVLADLVATWLAGFQGEGAEGLRRDLLKMHVDQVRKLIPANEKIMLDRLAGGTPQ